MQNLSSYGTFVLSSYLDNQQYGYVLGFLGVGCVYKEWYSKCINGLNLVKEASEEVYCTCRSYILLLEIGQSFLEQL